MPDVTMPTPTRTYAHIYVGEVHYTLLSNTLVRLHRCMHGYMQKIGKSARPLSQPRLMSRCVGRRRCADMSTTCVCRADLSSFFFLLCRFRVQAKDYVQTRSPMMGGKDLQGWGKRCMHIREPASERVRQIEVRGRECDA